MRICKKKKNVDTERESERECKKFVIGWKTEEKMPLGNVVFNRGLITYSLAKVQTC